MFTKFSPIPPPAARHNTHLPSVALQHVSVAYGTTFALEDVTLTLPRGEQVAIVGPNGAGKSTLFNVIAGIIQPTQGRVELYGSDPAGHICVGYVPQRNRIDWRFPVSVADVVMMGRTRKIGLFRRAQQQDHAAVAHALARVRMAEFAGRQIGELSGGQQQRVFLARALAQEAELLLLDEPLTGLDLPSQELLLQILDELQGEGITILVATHDLNQAAAYFSTVLLLNHRVVAVGAPADVLTTDLLRQAYGSQLHVVHSSDGDLIVADSCCGAGTPILADYGRAEATAVTAESTLMEQLHP